MLRSTYLRPLLIFGLMLALLFAGCSSNKETTRREEPMPLDAGQSYSASVAAGAVSSADIASGGVSSAEIAADAVTTIEILNETITAVDIAADAVGSSEIAPNAITTTEILNETITATDIAEGAVTSSEIINVVGSDEIATDVVGSAEIAVDEHGPAEISTDVVGVSEIIDGSVATLQLPSGYYSGGYPMAFGDVSAGEENVIIDDQVGSADIADNSIQSIDIMANTIVSEDIIGNTIISYDIMAGSSPEIIDNTITSQDIQEPTAAIDIVDNTIQSVDISSQPLQTLSIPLEKKADAVLTATPSRKVVVANGRGAAAPKALRTGAKLNTASPGRTVVINPKNNIGKVGETGTFKSAGKKSKVAKHDERETITEVITTPEPVSAEEYHPITENNFLSPAKAPLSTFSIDVDAASYSNTRRFINNGSLPPVDAVRIEEMVNYFTYDYPDPVGDNPFSINTETAVCPWNPKHRLVHIGLQGKRIPMANVPASNLVFLIDVSGSMDYPTKLPLLKKSFGLLVDQLREQDRVSIVVYAGEAGLVLPPTSGAKKKKIMEALDNLAAGGSTAGGAGIELAYSIAKQNFRNDGNNRVILATDGDFNVGVSSDSGLVQLIEEKRKEGIFLTVLGFGYGNYKDSKMEQLADKGNGNYAYIDNLKEAQKVLVTELGATLFTIAKDVKIQVDFNPAMVAAYRLIGYENRVLAARDFDDDTKDAGELGAGHSVTALYEVIPTSVTPEFAIEIPTDTTKYQLNNGRPSAYGSRDLMEVRLRFKHPKDTTSNLLGKIVVDSTATIETASQNFRFSASVAEFGLLLRNSRYKSAADYSHVLTLATEATGKDEEGYRTEFLELVKKAQTIAGEKGRSVGVVIE